MNQSAHDPAVRGAPRILVCGWSGAGNVGDELLTRAVVGVLREAGAIPVVASRDPETTSRLHGVETVAWGPRGWLSALAAGRARTRGPRVDGVCVGPGGIIEDWSSLWSLPGHLGAPRWLRRLGKPVAGVGLGAEHLVRESSRRLLRGVFENAAVVVRDAASAAALAAVGVEATVGCDLVFGLDLGPQARRSEIVVAVGPAVAPGRVRPASRRLTADDPSPLATALDALAARLDTSIALAAFRGQRDRDYAQLIAAKCQRPAEILKPDIDGQVDRIRSARLLISSRYHSVVVAASSGTPAIVCSTQAKLSSLVAQLGTPLIREIDGWSALSTCDVVAPTDVPVVPEGLDTHHAVLKRLVAAAVNKSVSTD